MMSARITHFLKSVFRALRFIMHAPNAVNCFLLISQKIFLIITVTFNGWNVQNTIQLEGCPRPKLAIHCAPVSPLPGSHVVEKKRKIRLPTLQKLVVQEHHETHMQPEWIKKRQLMLKHHNTTCNLPKKKYSEQTFAHCW